MHVDSNHPFVGIPSRSDLVKHPFSHRGLTADYDDDTRTPTDLGIDPPLDLRITAPLYALLIIVGYRAVAFHCAHVPDLASSPAVKIVAKAKEGLAIPHDDTRCSNRRPK
jgi:hypothetical protein